MKLDAAVIARLPRDAELSVTVKAGDLLEALARSDELPEFPSTVDVSKAWGFSPRKWREWAAQGLIPGAKIDDNGHYRLPREAAREQFERALGKDVPEPARTSHIPRAHGPRKKRETAS